MLEKVKRTPLKSLKKAAVNYNEKMKLENSTADGGSGQETAKLVIRRVNFQRAFVELTGTAPYVQNKMTRRAFEKMRAEMQLGQQSRSKKVRTPKKFEDAHRDAIHVSEDGWYGIPATGFRAAMIDACRLVGYQMTKAKMSVFVVADGFDRDDGQPLVKILAPEPKALEMVVRLPNGQADIAIRPQWKQGWKARVNLKWDADQFSDKDILNLMDRAGEQVGIGAGRPFSKDSVGMGWGTWQVRRGADED